MWSDDQKMNESLQKSSSKKCDEQTQEFRKYKKFSETTEWDWREETKSLQEWCIKAV